MRGWRKVGALNLKFSKGRRVVIVICNPMGRTFKIGVYNETYDTSSLMNVH